MAGDDDENANTERTTSDEIFLISFQSTKKQTNKRKKETGNVNRKSEALVGREQYFYYFGQYRAPPPTPFSTRRPLTCPSVP